MLGQLLLLALYDECLIMCIEGKFGTFRFLGLFESSRYRKKEFPVFFLYEEHTLVGNIGLFCCSCFLSDTTRSYLFVVGRLTEVKNF